ncbi:TIGR02301 family protein [Rhizobium deserti]|uniref:TIGR02301 family protein n=1 Tax=Rhizobium deserti TaxID=2547961 RepID=A0A4R5UJU4_9HYPH|nr:TIGR02301 family protein [Rhizobium deserti]TDK37152.1 TIGR02301 family protein [Rhizobium deserti]
MRFSFYPAFLCLLVLLAASPGAAQSSKQTAPKQPAPAAQPAPPPPAEEKPAPYDGQLIRLAEVLGSISYLRALCGAPQEDWRAGMGKLLDSDTANEPKRRERLTAAFNRGYRSFAAVHTACTNAALTAAERYRNEGATLAAEITSRFGN